ncbi:hypothetical protein BZA77DRAFT_309089 [Pyronema omphalodes]|nr:hypothetical protein BZA77DRAFT_309089 [Pyronema omphalodes]
MASPKSKSPSSLLPSIDLVIVSKAGVSTLQITSHQGALRLLMSSSLNQLLSEGKLTRNDNLLATRRMDIIPLLSSLDLNGRDKVCGSSMISRRKQKKARDFITLNFTEELSPGQQVVRGFFCPSFLNLSILVDYLRAMPKEQKKRIQFQAIINGLSIPPSPAHFVSSRLLSSKFRSDSLSRGVHSISDMTRIPIMKPIPFNHTGRLPTNEQILLQDNSSCMAKDQVLQYGPLPHSNVIIPQKASISVSDTHFDSGKEGSTNKSVSEIEEDETNAILPEDLVRTQSDYDYMDIDPSEFANDDYCSDAVIVEKGHANYEHMNIDPSEYMNDDYYGQAFHYEQYKAKVLERDLRILKWRDEVYDLIPETMLYMMEYEDTCPIPHPMLALFGRKPRNAYAQMD